MAMRHDMMKAVFAQGGIALKRDGIKIIRQGADKALKRQGMM